MSTGHVYKITNKVNGMWYIGSHNGCKSNYMGSGILITRAIKKYGKENFIKEILYEGPSFREEEEKILIKLNAKDNKKSYNIKNEALGGSFPGELNGMYGKKLTEEQKYKCGNAFRGKKRKDHSINMMGKNNPMYGKNEQVQNAVKLAKSNTGKTLEEIHGKEKAKEIKNKLSSSIKSKKKKQKTVICPHCKLEGKGPNMTRYHFNNCKNKG